jgi:hypothetical protein
MTHDLSANTEAWCLMSPEKRAAFEAHKGPITFLCDDGGWIEKSAITTFRQHWVYRAVPQPVRGEVVVAGFTYDGSWAFGEVFGSEDTHRLTLPTLYGNLIPGTYTGPDGATITVVALK